MTRGSKDESFFPSPRYLCSSAVPLAEHIKRCRRDTHLSSPFNRCPQSCKQLHLQDSLRTYPPAQRQTLRMPWGLSCHPTSKLISPTSTRHVERSHAGEEILTLCLNSIFSSKVMVSALAITGMMFTTLLRCFMNSRSKGRRLHPKREQHGRGHFTLLAFRPSDSASIRAPAKPPLCCGGLMPPCSHLPLPIHPALSKKHSFSLPLLSFQAPQHPKLS